MKNVGKLRPRHLFGAVARTIDGEMSTSDSYRPWFTCRKAHREAAEGLVGKCCAVAAGDEDRHMLHLRQLLQAAIEGADVVGCDISLVYSQADAHNATRIGVAC